MSFTKSLSILLFCLIQPFIVYSQSRVTTNLRLDVIASGIFQGSPEYETRSTEKNFIIPGPSAAIGAEFGYFLSEKKNTRLNLSLLTEYRNFTRYTENQYNSGFKSQDKRKFQTLALSLPLEIESTSGNFTIKGGLVASVNLQTKFKYTVCNSSPGESCEEWDYYSFTKVIGKSFAGNDLFSFEEIEMTRWIDLQYTIGFKHRLNDQISIGGEFRNFLLKNIISYTFFDYDVVGFEELRHQTNTIHLSLYYKVK